MYTGIIDHCGLIKEIVTKGKSLSLTIQCNFEDLIEGESICVNGFCITVVNPKKNYFQCDISPETLKLTNAQDFIEGTLVNIERSLRLMDRLGGHFVMGHVDTLYQLEKMEKLGDFTKMTFSGLEPKAHLYLIKKGSVCINGISLTINEVYKNKFEVMVIPHTLNRTNLHTLKVGEKVNIEFDLLSRITVNYLENSQIKVSE